MIMYFHIFTRYLPSYRMDVQESKDSSTITATFEVPALRFEDVVIQLQENHLTVSGERKTLMLPRTAAQSVMSQRQALLNFAASQWSQGQLMMLWERWKFDADTSVSLTMWRLHWRMVF